MAVFTSLNFLACIQALLRGLAGFIFCLSTAWAQPAYSSSPITVRPGDSFSAIAARYTGDLASWHQLYNARLSGLKDPNRLVIGMQLELVNDPSTGRYLRLVSASQKHPASANRLTTSSTMLHPVKPNAEPAPPVVPSGEGSALVEEMLTIGVVPNISANLLQAHYEHLRRYLERTGNGQKVRIVIPANFKAFFDGALRGDYDLSIAAPNLARVAQLDRGLAPLLNFEPRIAANLVTLREGGVTTPRDIQGKRLAFANPQSLVAMYGQQWLSAELRLEANRDYEVKAARTDLGVGRMMLTGEADAAIMSQGEFRSLPADEATRMRIVEVFARVPNFIVLAHPRIVQDQTNRLRVRLKDFLKDATDGAAFARATGLTGIVDVDQATLRELDAFVPATRKAMGY